MTLRSKAAFSAVFHVFSPPLLGVRNDTALLPAKDIYVISYQIGSLGTSYVEGAQKHLERAREPAVVIHDPLVGP